GSYIPAFAPTSRPTTRSSGGLSNEIKVIPCEGNDLNCPGIDFVIQVPQQLGHYYIRLYSQDGQLLEGDFLTASREDDRGSWSSPSLNAGTYTLKLYNFPLIDAGYTIGGNDSDFYEGRYGARKRLMLYQK